MSICTSGSISDKHEESLYQHFTYSVLQIQTSLDKTAITSTVILNGRIQLWIWNGIMEYYRGITVRCWWASVYLGFPLIIWGCGVLCACVRTVGLLTCGNTTEVSCGCDDIIHPAWGFPNKKHILFLSTHCICVSVWNRWDGSLSLPLFFL